MQQAGLKSEELHAEHRIMTGRLQQMEQEAREQREEHAQRMKQHQQIRCAAGPCMVRKASRCCLCDACACDMPSKLDSQSAACSAPHRDAEVAALQHQLADTKQAAASEAEALRQMAAAERAALTSEQREQQEKAASEQRHLRKKVESLEMKVGGGGLPHGAMHPVQLSVGCIHTHLLLHRLHNAHWEQVPSFLSRDADNHRPIVG